MKEQQVAQRLSDNFGAHYRMMQRVANNDRVNWEAVRKMAVTFLDTGKVGMVEDMKEIEEIATRKVEEQRRQSND